MTRDEYNKLFHKLELNLVAFKRLMDCDEEVLKLVNHAIEAEREACAKERGWVGLTEIEICDLEVQELTSASTETFSFARAIEAKLQEKNT